MTKVSAILLAGGVGTRMRSTTPKQFLPLLGKCVARYSFDLFKSMPEIHEIVVVCEEVYRKDFSEPDVLFAFPGPRRQDSVYNGFCKVSVDSDIVIIHDSARPLINRDMILRGIHAAEEHGAAVAAVPLKATVKQSRGDCFVDKTLDRSTLWEIQTPQTIKTALLRTAFEHALKHNLEVTDDVSLVEAIGYPVKLVEGGYSNLKITTPEDLVMAKSFLTRV
ncbi:MAG: 2-C-methyl-D-erythritol 4-phosphate cytidylyltransferase [Chlamydiales bacterium]|nr:2-C-methyl-D-erythritol 4-phosphate cytidylyltransferase [Chlamydiales bacterium]